ARKDRADKAAAAPCLGIAATAEYARAMGSRGVETVGSARDIGAGTEGAAGAGNDHCAHGVVLIGAIERVLELAAHRAGLGGELVRPIEGQDHERSVDLARDIFIHVVSLPCWTRLGSCSLNETG